MWVHSGNARGRRDNSDSRGFSCALLNVAGFFPVSAGSLECARGRRIQLSSRVGSLGRLFALSGSFAHPWVHSVAPRDGRVHSCSRGFTRVRVEFFQVHIGVIAFPMGSLELSLWGQVSFTLA